MLNQEIFKAYDIRGVYNVDFDDEFAYKLGLAYAKLLKKENYKEDLTIVVARDMRVSSPYLKNFLIRGLIDSGVNVIDINLASTPTFYFAVANYGYDGGIMVSASHNPKEYNGFKMTRAKAGPISGDSGIYTLRDFILEDDFEISETKGKIELKKDCLVDQIKYELDFSDLSKIKKMKIVIDTANGMGSQYLQELFKHLPSCEVIEMNYELDGTFPAHEADPLKEENMKDLQAKVLEVGADLGISTDGDGDRIFFVDDTGKTINQSIIRGLLAKVFLQDKPGSKVCYDIRPGKITYDLIIENGGIPIVTRVGHSLIKEQALEENAYFAGESSGHFFLNMDIGCFEVPMIVTLKMLIEFSQVNMKVSEYIKQYQKYFHSGEINRIVDSKEKVFQVLKEKYSNAKISELDGVTVEYDNFWFNVRGSNTEPKIRLNLEAISKEIMEEKRDEVLKLIK